MAKALAVPVGERVISVRPLESVRFHAHARMHGCEPILIVVSKWLDAYAELERGLGEHRPCRFEIKSVSSAGPWEPAEAAQAVRKVVGLRPDKPVRNICGLLDENRVKLLLPETKRDSLFGLSVGEPDDRPAVVVNV